MAQIDNDSQVGIIENLLKITIVVATIVAAPAMAYADSDGYYCTGSDYLAYQFGYDWPTRPVRLFVVRVGVVEPTELELAPFQVHGMRCEEGAVQLLGFKDLFTVRLDDSRRPIRSERSARPLEFLG